MLTESFIAAIESPEKPVAHSHSQLKDAGIFVHELQPIRRITSTFKKSSSKPHCLAVSASHVFAAQAGKAVLHIYSFARGGQESLIPFTEKISSLQLLGKPHEANILALGTEEGRLILWELCTGRQVTTPQSHLQSVSCLAVDPTFNFLLSGSLDGDVRVWSVPALLSFSGGDSSTHSSLRTLAGHRGGITALSIGHSHWPTDFAVSASLDKSCIIWDYRKGNAIQTILLPSPAISLVMDPADRAVFTGHEDGSITRIDLFQKHGNAFRTPLDTELSSMPLVPQDSDRWAHFGDSPSAARSLSLSYDGTIALTGHDNGEILAWDVAKGAFSAKVAELQAPVTCLQMMPLQGLVQSSKQSVQVTTVRKPAYEGSLGFEGSNGMAPSMVPRNYVFTALLTSDLPVTSGPPGAGLPDLFLDDYDQALSHSSFPSDLLEAGLTELMANTEGQFNANAQANDHLVQELELLKKQLAQSRAAQLAHVERCVDLNAELVRLQKTEQTRRRAKQLRRWKRERAAEAERRRHMGEDVQESSMTEHGEEGEAEEAGELSSTTDDYMSSD